MVKFGVLFEVRNVFLSITNASIGFKGLNPLDINDTLLYDTTREGPKLI
jgi:hypothetical protein